MFDNYPDPLVNFTCWNGDLDLYYQNGDKYVLSWGNAGQYGSLFFNFIREIDWEYLQANGYAVIFTAKADKSARFDLRFTEREDASGIPWRVRTTVDLAADGRWHTLRIPLADMREQGAWINARQEWRNSEGKFTWPNVDSFAFVAEDNDLHGITVLFDTIKIE
jgi:hypothetical protein